MKLRSFTLVPDHVVLQDFRTVDSETNRTTARLIELMAVVDERRLYAAEGYESMLAFCMGDRNMSEDCARKRIQVARAAQRVPAVLTAVAEGRLHLTAVVMLAPHLTPENARVLIEEASHSTKEQIAIVLARHFPKPDLTAGIEVVPCSEVIPLMSAERVPEPVQALVNSQAGARVEPSSPGRFAVQFMLDDAAHAELEYARALCRHAVPSGDVAEFYRWAVREAIKQGEKRAFAATARPRASKGAPKGRHVPAQVKREVWERDQGRCTFVSGSGRRCEANARLEYDHIEPVACGGMSTTANLRLRCRAHNQLEAERRFGKGFMARKKQEARHASVQVRDESEVTQPSVDAGLTVYDPDHTTVRTRRDEIIPYLRALGLRVDEAKRGAAMCDHLHDVSLEHRVKFALAGLGRARFERSTCPASAGPSVSIPAG